MVHELKIWPEYFKAMKDNKKKFEVRKNDRDFQIGHFLKLNEWDNEFGKFTGNSLYYEITYILHGGQFGIKEGYCVISII